jgi:hypothetical protein
MGETAFAAVPLATFRAYTQRPLATATQTHLRTQLNFALMRYCSLREPHPTSLKVLKLFYVSSYEDRALWESLKLDKFRGHSISH